jgi:hypothetical protein
VTCRFQADRGRHHPGARRCCLERDPTEHLSLTGSKPIGGVETAQQIRTPEQLAMLVRHAGSLGAATLLRMLSEGALRKGEAIALQLSDACKPTDIVR